MSLIRIILFVIAVVFASALDPYDCQCFETRGIDWGSDCHNINEPRICIQKTENSGTLGNCVHESRRNGKKICQLVVGSDASYNYWEFKSKKKLKYF